MSHESLTASVVVPCGSTASELERCLIALGRQEVDFAYEVVVVDSFLSAEVASCVKRFEFVRLVRPATAPLTAGTARNVGAESCTARYLAFCDADCAPEPGWLAAAVAALDEGVAAVTGPVSDLVTRPVAIADNMLQFVDFSEKRERGPITHAPGCNLALRRTVFLEAGGFASGLGEDVLFSRELVSRSGAPVTFDPGMRQRHAGRPTIRALIEHHRSFGAARGELGLLLSRTHERFGEYRLMVPVFALRRYGYLVVRTLQLNPLRFVFVVTLTPLLLLGLSAWALAFREGCLRRTMGEAP